MIFRKNLYVCHMMMMIAPNSRSRKEGEERGKVKGEYGKTSGEEENADYGIWCYIVSNMFKRG